MKSVDNYAFFRMCRIILLAPSPLKDKEFGSGEIVILLSLPQSDPNSA